MVAGDVLHAELVDEAALGVPGDQARVVVGQLLQRRVAQLGALGVVPDRLIGVGGVGHRFIGLEHPLRDGAEVEDHRVRRGGIQEVDGHGIDERKIPARFARGGRLELGHGELRIRQPGDVADIIRAELAQLLVSTVVNLRARPQRRVDDHLQRGGGPRFAHDLIPLDIDGRRQQRGGARQQKNEFHFSTPRRQTRQPIAEARGRSGSLVTLSPGAVEVRPGPGGRAQVER